MHFGSHEQAIMDAFSEQRAQITATDVLFWRYPRIGLLSRPWINKKSRPHRQDQTSKAQSCRSDSQPTLWVFLDRARWQFSDPRADRLSISKSQGSCWRLPHKIQ